MLRKALASCAATSCVECNCSITVSVRVAPRYMRSDNGPEFVSRAILTWVRESNIETALSDLGRPWQNGTDERFNGRFEMNI